MILRRGNLRLGDRLGRRKALGRPRKVKALSKSSVARTWSEEVKSVFVRDALLQERMDGKVRCNVCERRCTIVPGGFGWCRTRQNRHGRLVTLIYGSISSMAVNPIEKKPFYHFHPGTKTLTAGSWSCNFGCPWCQNWEIAKSAPPVQGNYVSPPDFIDLVEESGCQGTSVSFNEPTLSLEWSVDVFGLARPRGFYNTFVTNGYMTPEALSLLIDSSLEAMNIDIKGDARAVKKFSKRVDIEKVWAIAKLARARGVHIELTTLVIPTVNDTDSALRGIAERIARDLGPQVPWHVSGYFPAYRFTVPPTPSQTLERAWQIGKEAGLEFVYTGNVPGDPHENTYCPACGELLIRRMGFDIVEYKLNAGRCPGCGRPLEGVWPTVPL